MNILKFLAKGLISNEHLSQNSKKQKWWLAFIVLVLSVVISVIPTFSTIANTEGGALIQNHKTQNIDYSLERFSYEYLNQDKATIVMQIEQGKLVFPDDSKTFDTNENKKTMTLLGGDLNYVEISQTLESKTNVTLVATYIDYHAESDTRYLSLTDKINDFKARLVTTYKTDAEIDTDGYSTGKMINSLIFTESQIIITVYENNAVGKFKADADGAYVYKDTPATVYLYSGLLEGVSTANSNLTDLTLTTSTTTVLDNWRTLLNEAYSPIKTTAMVINTLIYASLNVMMMLVMTVGLFIMTRFKSSQCEKLSFGNALKLTSFAALCPALLSMLLGFFMVQLQSVAFLLLFGMRMIFLSTRMTRGAAPAPEPKSTKK